jgi:hypothetical protein
MPWTGRSPQGIACDWSVTGINTADGTLFGVLTHADGYGFDGPDGAAFDGSRMWFTNSGGNSVTDVPVT